jgi:hypothetical protein
MQQVVADLFLGDRTALTASASAAAGHPVTLPQRVVLVGHSEGGGLVVGAAGDMATGNDAADLGGVIMLDGSTLDRNLIATAAAKIPADRPILLIASSPSYWNRLGAIRHRELLQLRSNAEIHPLISHCSASIPPRHRLRESPPFPSDESGPVYPLICRWTRLYRRKVWVSSSIRDAVVVVVGARSTNQRTCPIRSHSLVTAVRADSLHRERPTS